VACQFDRQYNSRRLQTDQWRELTKEIARHRYWRIALLLLSLSVTASAQEFRGSLTGRITDPTGAALPGAEVSVRNVETNITSKTTANEGSSWYSTASGSERCPVNIRLMEPRSLPLAVPTKSKEKSP
jgi:hypothetical protein